MVVEFLRAAVWYAADNTGPVAEASSTSRCISAVIWDGACLRLTRWKVAVGLLDLFIPRDDLYIGCTELLAVLLCFYTFRDLPMETFWTCYIEIGRAYIIQLPEADVMMK